VTIEEARDMKDPQLQERIGELQEELFRLRFRSAMMQLENPRVPGRIRRDIALMKTVIRERELRAKAG
jgi:large subunit ribosomal protein L29